MAERGIFEKSDYGKDNRIAFSRLNFFEKKQDHHLGISIKYVIEGTETYKINNAAYKVNSDHYLLINPSQSYDVYLRSNTDILGVCLNIDSAIINDVYNTMSLSVKRQLDNPTAMPNAPLEVFENIYNAKSCPLGIILKNLGSKLQSTAKPSFESYHLYYKLAETLLETQGLVQRKIYQIKAERFVTQQELFRRIEHGMRTIEEEFFKPLKIEELAAASALSPFHFSRTFKQVYRISPYQYILQRRLEKAKEHLESDNMSIAEIASSIGFADIHSFSKSFKNTYSISPKAYRLLKAETRVNNYTSGLASFKPTAIL